jgi:hypothetical protein
MNSQTPAERYQAALRKVLDQLIDHAQKTVRGEVRPKPRPKTKVN